MATPAADVQAQLVLRRDRLESVMRHGGGALQLDDLLREVDEALARLSAGTYGRCETCGDAIEAERLEADPLVRFCLDHLTPFEARALEQDLDLAGRVQQTLLPPSLVVDLGWELAYQYQPFGAVSGDYCDALREPDTEGLVVLLGDVSGKGVAASMLMAHLHASMRTLMAFGLPLNQIVQRANRVFCESTMANHYATLAAARFAASGSVEICNAGHCPPLHSRRGEVVSIEATGVPIGLFCVREYGVRTLSMSPGDVLVLYTDGVTEARSPSDEEYGEERLKRLVAQVGRESPQAIVDACAADVAAFRGAARRTDDLTIMAIRRLVQ
jgi:sigma-B regulation protein RsbU (phosphoserine phosphatase)